MSLTINGKETNKFALKQGEGKTLSFTYNVSIDSATFSLACKNASGILQFSKDDEDFDKTEIANNIISVILTTEDLDLEVGTYDLEVKATWDSLNNVDKTSQLKLHINESVH